LIKEEKWEQALACFEQVKQIAGETYRNTKYYVEELKNKVHLKKTLVLPIPD
jgi:hypothetical protein